MRNTGSGPVPLGTSRRGRSSVRPHRGTGRCSDDYTTTISYSKTKFSNVLAPALGLGDFNPPLHGSVPGKDVPPGE